MSETATKPEAIGDAGNLIAEAYQLAGALLIPRASDKVTEAEEIRLLDILAYDLPDAIAAMNKPAQVDEGLIKTARDVMFCAAGWESDARLLGNVRAADIYALCADYLNRPYLRDTKPVEGSHE